MAQLFAALIADVHPDEAAGLIAFGGRARGGCGFSLVSGGDLCVVR